MEAVTTEIAQGVECSDQGEVEMRVADFDSIAIQRLVSEIRSEEPALVGPRYDRTYNRHNR